MNEHKEEDKISSKCPVSQQKGTSGGCPYKFGRGGEGTGTGDKSSFWTNPATWFMSATATGVDDKEIQASVGNENVQKSSAVASLEEAAAHPQQRVYASQKVPLNTYRVKSSIPRADEFLPEGKDVPKHQDVNEKPGETVSEQGPFWVYPSEQQFYNAMKRKGWDPNAEEMGVVVAIHNLVNERGWREVRRWEKLMHGVDEPRLIRFEGRPKDMSPKAWINSTLLSYKPPFDRHDWYVERDGKPVRYVIDFYNGSNRSEDDIPDKNLGMRSSMYLDVRPALDTPQAFVDRVRMAFSDTFPGIFESGEERK